MQSFGDLFRRSIFPVCCHSFEGWQLIQMDTEKFVQDDAISSTTDKFEDTYLLWKWELEHHEVRTGVTFMDGSEGQTSIILIETPASNSEAVPIIFVD